MARFAGKLIAATSLLLILALPLVGNAQYLVDDSNFTGGVYEFLYSTKANTADNGGATIVGDPWLSNSSPGWTHDPNRSVNVGDWHLPGSTFATYSGTGISGTVGFDFSQVSGKIHKLEIDPSNFLFCWEARTEGDTITGEVATPDNFGDGGFVQLYHFVAPAPAGCPNSSMGPVYGGAMLDVTPFLSQAWLDSPGLLEFRFSHGSPGSPFIVAENTQVFRQDTLHDFEGVDYGLRLHVELAADDDRDGVDNGSDVCADTAIPESVPEGERGLGVNRWALVDDDGIFDTAAPPGGGTGPQLEFTIADTAGCSCEQIVAALELGKGHRKHGCSISAMEAYVELVNP